MPETEPRPDPPLARRPARGGAPGGADRGRLKVFLGAAPGVGKTYEMLTIGQRPARRPALDVVVGVVETHGRAETEALLDGFEVDPAPGRAVPRHRARRDGPRRAARPPAGPGAGRRARPHQRAGLAPPEALPGRRGTARRRHRRLDHAQHPARREPQRRGRADHPHPGARDRAGRRPRPGRRHRGGRPQPRRPDPAPEGRQGLRPDQRRARPEALLLPRQPDGPARAGAPAHRRPGRRRAARPHAGQRHRRALGGGRARAGLRERGSRARPASCATPSAWPTGCTRPGRRSPSRAPRGGRP